YIIHIAPDVIVTVGQQFTVAIEAVYFPGYDGNGTGPVQSIVRAITPSSCGNDIRKHTVGLLFVSVVSQPFLIDGDPVEIIKGGFYGKMAVAGPAVLLPLRAVGGVSHQV